MPLVAVVPVAPLVRLKVVPSAVRTSEAPLLRLPTVSWRLVMVWPASIVEAAAPANSDTDEPSSVKVGLDAPALNVGASFTAGEVAGGGAGVGAGGASVAGEM